MFKNKHGLIIGITGFAGTGKNLFADLLLPQLHARKIKAEQFSFAKKLRKDLFECCKFNIGIDPFTRNPKEKEILRPLFVTYAKIIRRRTGGTYFVKALERRVAEPYQKGTICVISDARHCDYPDDELSFVKKFGILVNIDRFSESKENGQIIKTFIGPANEEEARNGPKMKENADWLIEWSDAPAAKDKAIKDFLVFLDTVYKL